MIAAGTKFAAANPEQEARFVAFTRQCNDLIRSSEGHGKVLTFLATLDIDSMRALRQYAVAAVAPELVGLIDRTWSVR